MEIRKYINIASVVAIIFYLATLYFYPENLELRMVMQRLVFAAIFLNPTNPDETLFRGKFLKIISWPAFAFFVAMPIFVPYNHPLDWQSGVSIFVVFGIAVVHRLLIWIMNKWVKN
ncbi:hypothetical protein [Aerococcus urinaeequi]|uniref:hypothetical protein n=1 Tax=Aerococcus urinaeequi TaxID=51665 RepID=UPI00366E2AB1